MKHVSAWSVLGVVVALALCTAHPARAASSEVTLATATGTVYGTLLVPDGVNAPMPVALIVAGSGPTDRDGNNPAGVAASSYRLLAEALAARGIATLRYDKRGIAASAAAMPKPASAVQFTDYVDDAVAWARQLRADARFSRVAIVGHSEGSLIALLAANRTPVDAVVSVSGSGRPLGDVIVGQIAAGGPAAAPFVASARAAVAELKAGKTPTDVPAPLASIFPAYLTTFLSQFFNADPVAAAHALTVPLAVVQGTADIQISTDDAQLLHAADPRSTLTLVPHMTHTLKDATDDTRAASLATYSDAGLPIDATAVAAIAAGVLATR
jgi:alpha-beta hydrolase superfamily lysophospholipase